MYTELGDDRFVLVTRSDLGHMLRSAGELDEAAAIYRETILGWGHIGNRGAIANQYESFALIAMERGEERRAATLLGAAASLREVAGAHMMPWERETYDAALARLRASIDPAAFEAAWAAGSRLDQEAAIALAVGGSVTGTTDEGPSAPW